MVVELVGGLERLGGADQHAGLGALAGGDHDRQRCGQPQRARAGDDQHRHRGDQRERERRVGADVEPHDERGDGDEEHRRARTSATPRRRGAGSAPWSSGPAHEADDLGEHRVAADLGGPHPERAGLVDGGADDDVARSLGDRHRLAGDHRLVERWSGRRGSRRRRGPSRPGRTSTTSPGTTSSTGTSTSMPSRTTRAVRACRPRRRRMASPVPALARASSSRPSMIRVMITPTASK